MPLKRQVGADMEERRCVYDEKLMIEAYQFVGVMQKFPNHFHEHFVIGFIENGTRKLSCLNKEYVIHTGDLMLFNPRDNHTCEQIDNSLLDYRCLNIPENIMQNTILEITGKKDFARFKKQVIAGAEQTQMLRELHEMIMQGSQEFQKEELFLFFMEQLILIYAELNPAEEEDNMKLEKVCRFVEESYEKAITLDELSKIAQMNKYVLLRTFTREKGITPYQYLLTTRINKARTLLEKGIEPIDVAIHTGFSDQSHFTNVFKKLIGVTPGQYKSIRDKG